MSKTETMLKVIISNEDIMTVQKLAQKYNLTVKEFSRIVSRSTEVNARRYIRLTEEEYANVKLMAMKHGTTVTHWCAHACHMFLVKRPELSFLQEAERSKDGSRSKRICAAVRNGHDEAELTALAKMYSVGTSTLIRFCILHYNGSTFN